jgi:hypothetical protein
MALPQAVLGLDDRGNVLFGNAAAEELLRESDGLAVERRRLFVDVAREQATLDRLIIEAVNSGVEIGTGWARVSRPSGKLPYAVFVAPMDSLKDELASVGVRVAVVVHDLAKRQSVNPNCSPACTT